MDPEFKKRLLETYRIEADEHLETIGMGIRSLEEGAGGEKQKRILEDTYRQFHNLKGAARAVGETAVDTICHRCEDILSRASQQEIPVSSDLLHRLGEAVSLLRRLHQSDASESPGDSERDVERVTQLLVLEEVSGGDAQAGKERKEPDAGEASETVPEISKPTEESPRSIADFGSRSGTVRTPVERLDAILYRSEEMLGLREEGGRHLGKVTALRDQLFEWRKESGKAHLNSLLLRRFADDTESDDLSSEVRNAIRRVYEFLEWNRQRFSELEVDIRELVKGSVARHGEFEVNVDRLLDETKELLMVPFSHEMEGLKVFVESARRGPAPKQARLRIEGGEVEVDRRILETMKDPFIHLVRNAIDHGLESADERQRAGKPTEGTLRIRVTPLGDGRVEVMVADDGRGLQVELVREKAIARGLLKESSALGLPARRLMEFIFEPNFSTRSEVSGSSGRGIGLSIAKENAERLGGHISVSSEEGEGTAFRIVIPLSIARFRAVEVTSGGRPFLLPSAKVVRVGRVKRSSIRPVKGRDTIRLDAEVLPLFRLSRILGLKEAGENGAAALEFVTMNERGTEFALEVEALGEEREAVLKNIGPQLRHVLHIAGASVGAYGEIVPVIHAADVARTVAGGPVAAPPVEVEETDEKEKMSRVLVVEDSITARNLLKSILEGGGYKVTTARDGAEGLGRLRRDKFDLVLTDLDMPRLNGFELTKAIRRDEKLKDLPIVILTALASREDKERGVEAGADAYVVKSRFDQSDILNTLKELLRND